MNPILKKLWFKAQSPVLVLQAPAEFKKILEDMGEVHSAAKGKYSFVLAFVKSLAEGEKLAKRVKKSLEDGCVFWVAYPKGTSKRYQSNYQRDTGHALMAKHGFNGASLVSINEDWSAMRFKF